MQRGFENHSSNIIDAISIPIGTSTSHKVEATAALYTMRLVVEIGYQYLWMEGGSLNIINMLNGKNPTTWSIEASVMKIKTLMGKFEKVIFSHIYYEGNIVVDQISNQVVLQESKLRWNDNLRRSVDLKELINYDRNHATEGNIS